MRPSMFSRRTWRQAAISAVGSVKVKLLLFCCIVFILLAFTTRTLSFDGKNHHSAALFKSCFPNATASFGIAFDIDGVLLRGSTPIGGSPKALTRLYADSGDLRIPYVFLTNGGGVPESKRATELAKLLGVNIEPLQVIHGHSPFKQLVKRFGNQLVIALGKGEPATVMSEYGFKNVISMDEYASCFKNIDPLEPYKKFKTDADRSGSSNLTALKNDPFSHQVQAVFVVSDPVDWSRDIQVLCDILRTGGRPGKDISHNQPPLFFANDDLAYQALFPSERLGLGAFRIALEAVFNSIHPNNLEYTPYGKPQPLAFENAETVLKKVALTAYGSSQEDGEDCSFRSLYMIGDNPYVDIKGAQQAGHPWHSILTRTGVFRGKQNHAEHPADTVVDTVEDAIDFILKRENIS